MIDPETARQVVQAWNEARGWANEDLMAEAGDGLAVLVPQLLDRCHHAEQRVGWWKDEAHALGERCRQAEVSVADGLTALRRAWEQRDALMRSLTETAEWLTSNGHPIMATSVRESVGAALGDTPPRPGFYEDDEDPAKVRAVFDAGEKGYTTGTRSVTHDLRAAVVPPQPETPEEAERWAVEQRERMRREAPMDEHIMRRAEEAEGT